MVAGHTHRAPAFDRGDGGPRFWEAVDERRHRARDELGETGGRRGALFEPERNGGSVRHHGASRFVEVGAGRGRDHDGRAKNGDKDGAIHERRHSN